MNAPLSAINLKFLDGLRGLAALYVLIGHARWLLWEGWEGYRTHPGSYSLFDQAQAYLLLAFKFGHEMVLFFFVLSGFVIHLKYSYRLKADPGAGFDVLTYITRRARRIFPPLLAALLLTYACDRLVAQGHFSIYSHLTPVVGLNQNINFNHSWSTLVGNLLLLQGEGSSTYPFLDQMVPSGRCIMSGGFICCIRCSSGSTDGVLGRPSLA